LSTIFLVLLGLDFLAALGFGGYLAITWAAGLLGKRDVQIVAPTNITPLVLLLAAMIVASSVRRASKPNKAHPLHGERTATYELFADLWGALVAGGEAGSTDLSAQRRTLDRLMTLYAGAGPLKAHLALRALERERGPGDPAVRLQLAEALLAIRRDLGVETRGLAAEQLQALFEAELRSTPALSTKAPPAPALAQPPTFKDFRPHVSLTPDV
jgi:hypothetical protein